MFFQEFGLLLLCIIVWNNEIFLSFIIPQDVIIDTHQGRLKGKIATDYYGKPFYSFEAIPYAQPPINELRFKAPQPAEPWSGILDATKPSTVCMQRDDNNTEIVFGSEDCLYLNIYTKEIPDENANQKLKPVMFWVHGGGLQMGSPYITQPDYLISEDIVVVTITYRLNIFGLLSFEDSKLEIPGNAGLKDQVMALKWVQANIRHFGGDPNSVTIFGESAGSASTHLLYLSPMTKGLFHRVIGQSGSAMNPWVSAPRRYQLLSDRLDCGTTDPAEILKCFQNTAGEKLLLNCIKLDPEVHTGEMAGEFGVVVEETSNEEAFLPEPIQDIITRGSFNDVPFLTGYNTHEGVTALKILVASRFDPKVSDVQFLVPNDTNVLLGTQEAIDLGNKIKNFYFGSEIEITNDTIRQFIDYATDVAFLEKMHRNVKGQVAVAKSPIYFYHFGYATELNYYYKDYQTIVAHADDLGYLFVLAQTPKLIPSGSDMAIGIHRMVNLWTRFAKTGNPNVVEPDPLLNVKWEPVTKEKFNYLDISPKLQLKQDPEKRRMEFWEKFYGDLK